MIMMMIMILLLLLLLLIIILIIVEPENPGSAVADVQEKPIALGKSY